MTARLPDGEQSVTVYKWLWKRERRPVPRGRGPFEDAYLVVIADKVQDLRQILE